MIKQYFNTKAGSAVAVAASLVIAGTIASASAAPSGTANANHGSGYTKDQCKNGGWRDFKNTDGSQKFRNQGQCVAYFAHQSHGNQRSFFAAFVAFVFSFLSWFSHLFSGFGSILRL